MNFKIVNSKANNTLSIYNIAHNNKTAKISNKIKWLTYKANIMVMKKYNKIFVLIIMKVILVPCKVTMIYINFT